MADPISGNQQVKIASGQKLSEIIDLSGAHFLTLSWPATMDSATFTVLGVCGSGKAETLDAAKAATFQAINDDAGASIGTFTITVSVCTSFRSAVMSEIAGYRYIRLQTNLNETADRLVGVGTKA